jgi:uncharacterized protein
LGRLYYRGQGVEKSLSKAATYFRKSAKAGHGGAQLLLGRLHLLGKGVSKDSSQAYYWLTLAASQDQAAAKKLITKAEDNLSPEKIEIAKKRAMQFRPK